MTQFPPSRPAAAIVYPYIPHYRLPVFRELSASQACRYIFLAGTNTIDSSIASVHSNSNIDIRNTPITTYRGITLQFGVLKYCLSNECQNLVFLGDPHFALTWVYTIIARLRGKKVWFWTHGWLRQEHGAKRILRNSFYRIASGLLLYGERARDIGRNNNFTTHRLHVIYNSLDYQRQREVRELCASEKIKKPDTLPDKYFACIARLTPICKFEHAILALANMAKRTGIRVPLVLIGSGPSKDLLAQLAISQSVEVRFLGEIYDEEIIGPVLFHARAIVSPGKVGLTAMHSLAYGTPVITHGDLNNQMPEVESVIPDRTGDLFPAGDVASLSQVLEKWIKKSRNYSERDACVSVIEQKFNPATQVKLIEEALLGKR